MFEVQDIMSSPVHTISTEKSVFQAASYMKKLGFGGLPVIDNEKMVGIITSSDIYFSHPNRLVADSMTKKVIYCSPADIIWDVVTQMTKYNIKRLPVVNKGHLVGLLTKSIVTKYMGNQYDPLTSIHNSIYIYQLANRLITEGHEISVILFDINNFGHINKEYGHVYGDKCIKNIAEIISKHIDNDCDFLCRYGGDEFVIVSLRKVNDASKLVQSVVAAVKKESIEMGKPLSISAGVCGGQRKHARKSANKVIENLINKASLASTKAKRIGKEYLLCVDS